MYEAKNTNETGGRVASLARWHRGSSSFIRGEGGTTGTRNKSHKAIILYIVTNKTTKTKNNYPYASVQKCHPPLKKDQISSKMKNNGFFCPCCSKKQLCLRVVSKYLVPIYGYSHLCGACEDHFSRKHKIFVELLQRTLIPLKERVQESCSECGILRSGFLRPNTKTYVCDWCVANSVSYPIQPSSIIYWKLDKKSKPVIFQQLNKQADLSEFIKPLSTSKASLASVEASGAARSHLTAGGYIQRQRASEKTYAVGGEETWKQ